LLRTTEALLTDKAEDDDTPFGRDQQTRGRSRNLCEERNAPEDANMAQRSESLICSSHLGPWAGDYLEMESAEFQGARMQELVISLERGLRSESATRFGTQLPSAFDTITVGSIPSALLYLIRPVSARPINPTAPIHRKTSGEVSIPL
jgi:hypothetical protein